jgi:hypothetical protein
MGPDYHYSYLAGGRRGAIRGRMKKEDRKNEQEKKERPTGGDSDFRAAVEKGIGQADRGEFIEEEEMDERVKRMLRP